jgi:hypothetical protein
VLRSQLNPVPGKLITWTGGKKKPFTYASSEEEDSTAKALSGLLVGRPPMFPNAAKLESKPDPPEPLHDSGGVFEGKAWSTWLRTKPGARFGWYGRAVFPGSELLAGIKPGAAEWHAAERYVEACGEEFDALAVVRASVRGTTLICAAGSFKVAAAMVRGVWTSVFGTNLGPTKIAQIEKNLPREV